MPSRAGAVMKEMHCGQYRARPATLAEDLRRAQALRWLCFRRRGWACAPDDAAASGPCQSDTDRFDALCDHVLIENLRTGALAGCFRVRHLRTGAEIRECYSAQFYGLDRLAQYPAPSVELGRFCLHPGQHDPRVLRLAWAFLTDLVEAAGAALVFGCTSFSGEDAAACARALGPSLASHLAPPRWRPEVRAPHVIRLLEGTGLPGSRSPERGADHQPGIAGLPPLLRSYLGLGAWISDHAVIDDDLGTVHVFTALETAAIPARRLASLRALAEGLAMRGTAN